MNPKKEVFQPDDRFFRQAMSDRSVAKAYLQHFYPKIASITDLDTLHLENSKAIRPNLKIFNADILYRCRFKGEQNKHFYFSLLFEHKSQPDDYVAIQVGVYMMLTMHRMIKEKRLEPIIPLLFYNGKKPWRPKTIPELFKEYPHYQLLEPYLPDFSFLFKDATRIPPKTLLGLELSYFRSILVSMAWRYKPNLLFQHLDLIFEGAESKARMKAIIVYILAVAERSPSKFMEDLENIEFTTKPNAMSTLEMLRSESMEKGAIKEKVFSLLRLANKLPDPSPEEIAEITQLPITQIEYFYSLLAERDQTALNKLIYQELLSEVPIKDTDKQVIQSLVDELL